MAVATGIGSGLEGFICPAGISHPLSGFAGTPLGEVGSKNLVQIGGAQNTFGAAGNMGMGHDCAVDLSVGQGVPLMIAEGSFMMPPAAGTYVFSLQNALANVLDVVDPPPSPPASWPISSAGIDLITSSFTVIVPYNLAPSDFDEDGDVDQSDFGHWQSCFTGPARPYPVGCDDADLDGDGDIDHDDLSRFDLCKSGPAIGVSDACMESI